MKQYECSHMCKEASDLFSKFRSGLAVSMINYHRGKPTNKKEVEEVLGDLDGVATSLRNIKEILKEL